MNTGRFTFEWVQQPAKVENISAASHHLIARESEIFIPSLISAGRNVKVEGLDGSYVFDESRQTLFILPASTSTEIKHHIIVSLDPPLEQEFIVNDFWFDFGSHIISALVVLLGILVYILLGK